MKLEDCKVGARVVNSDESHIYFGSTGVIIFVGDPLGIKLDKPTPTGVSEVSWYASRLSLYAPTPVTTQRDLTSFFKGPTNYKKCPNCGTGRLVPMFSGAAACDQACERSKPAGSMTEFF